MLTRGLWLLTFLQWCTEHHAYLRYLGAFTLGVPFCPGGETGEDQPSHCILLVPHFSHTESAIEDGGALPASRQCAATLLELVCFFEAVPAQEPRTIPREGLAKEHRGQLR